MVRLPGGGDHGLVVLDLLVLDHHPVGQHATRCLVEPTPRCSPEGSRCGWHRSFTLPTLSTILSILLQERSAAGGTDTTGSQAAHGGVQVSHADPGCLAGAVHQLAYRWLPRRSLPAAGATGPTWIGLPSIPGALHQEYLPFPGSRCSPAWSHPPGVQEDLPSYQAQATDPYAADQLLVLMVLITRAWPHRRPRSGRPAGQSWCSWYLRQTPAPPGS